MVRRRSAAMNRSFNSDTSTTTRIHGNGSTACDHARAGKQRFQAAPQRAPLLAFFLVLGNIRRLFPRSTNRAAQLLSRSRSSSSHSVRSLQANHFDAHAGTVHLAESAILTSNSVILSEAKDLCQPRNCHRSTRDRAQTSVSINIDVMSSGNGSIYRQWSIYKDRCISIY